MSGSCLIWEITRAGWQWWWVAPLQWTNRTIPCTVSPLSGLLPSNITVTTKRPPHPLCAVPSSTSPAAFSLPHRRHQGPCRSQQQLEARPVHKGPPAQPAIRPQAMVLFTTRGSRHLPGASQQCPAHTTGTGGGVLRAQAHASDDDGILVGQEVRRKPAADSWSSLVLTKSKLPGRLWRLVGCGLTTVQAALGSAVLPEANPC